MSSRSRFLAMRFSYAYSGNGALVAQAIRMAEYMVAYRRS